MIVEAEYPAKHSDSIFKVVRRYNGKYVVEQHFGTDGKFASHGTYTAKFKAVDLAKTLAERS